MGIKDEIMLGENKKLEFKSEMIDNKKFAKTIVAFSNTSGGKFIIGVEDNGSIIGVDPNHAPTLIDTLSNIIDDTCAPQISLERERENVGFDEEICFNYERNPVNEEKFANDFLKFSGKQLNENDFINLKLLKSKDESLLPTNGYVLLTDTSRYFEYVLIKCARFKGNDTSHFIDRKEIECPIYEQIEAAIKFAEMYIALGSEFQGARRIDKYAIPMKAIREALANAVVHRDYGKDTASIIMNIFDNRIEITSPGALPGMLDVEQIKMGRSEIRNRVIARVLKEMGFIEQWGTGINRIISECKDLGIKEPVFEEVGQGFRVTIYALEN